MQITIMKLCTSSGYSNQCPNQNRIRKILATRSDKQTSVLNPVAFLDLFIIWYCGIYGTTPPKIMKPLATKLTSLANVSGSASGRTLSLCTSAMVVAFERDFKKKDSLWFISNYFERKFYFEI